MEPLKFIPQFVPKIWGGRRLEASLGKNIPSGKIGESWEISGYPSNLTLVASGEYAGMSVYDLAKQSGKDIFGRHAPECEREFPLLLKFLDASDVLSVQVHPDDAYAKEHDSSLGKSEAWIIVDCDPGSFLYRGFRDGATLADFDRLLAEGRLDEILKPVEVEPGDCIDLPARTVHAIGKGILLCEIQQSSDATYRVYDWNRVGSDGKPRPLHIEKARDVMDFTPQSLDKIQPRKIPADGGSCEVIVDSDKFVLERICVESTMRLESEGDSFRLLCVLGGEGRILWGDAGTPIRRGDSFLIPASLDGLSLSSDGSLTAAVMRMP